MSLNTQFYLLTHTLLYGIFLGICLDSVDLFLRNVKNRIFIKIILILHWLMQFMLAMLFFHRVSHGQFHSYLLLIVLLGTWIYFKLLKKKYLKELEILMNFASHLLNGIKKLINVIIFTPILFIFNVISDIIVIPKSFFRKLLFKEMTKQDGDI